MRSSCSQCLFISNEIPDNNIDDDQNGYIDDLHGWHFLAATELENMESVRLQKKEDPESEAYKKWEKSRLKNLEDKGAELMDINEIDTIEVIEFN